MNNFQTVWHHSNLFKEYVSQTRLDKNSFDALRAFCQYMFTNVILIALLFNLGFLVEETFAKFIFNLLHYYEFPNNTKQYIKIS